VLANTLWWIAHDDHGGLRRPRRVVGLGLAAGLLSELVLSEKITVWKSRVVVCNRAPPADPIAQRLYDEILMDREHGLRDWMDAAAVYALEWVAARLLHAGLVRPSRSRARLGRRVMVYPPVRVLSAAAPTAQIALALERREPLSAEEVVVVGLARAMGLADQVISGLVGGTEVHYLRLEAQLDPMLREVIGTAAVAVTDAVLTYRTR
jgi:hypothetical protein